MARIGRKAGGKGSKAKAAEPGTAVDRADKPGLKLPSPDASTNLVIADVVLRAAGGLLRDRMEKGLLVRHYGDAKANRMVDKRSLAASAMLWGASRLARRSPLGLAVVAGGLAAKVFYDRGKRLETRRAAKKPDGRES